MFSGSRQRRPVTWLWSVRVGVFVLALVGATGCTVGPAPVRPETVVDDAAEFVHGPAAAQPAEDVGRWWEDLGDPVSRELVEQALRENTELRASAARVLAARSNLRVVGGARWPRVEASLTTDRSQRNFQFSDERFSVQSTTIAVRGDVAWQADLFGKLRREEQAAWYELLSTEAGRAALTHTVVADVVSTRVLIATLEQSLEVARKRVDSFEKTSELVRLRAEHELASGLEVQAARESLAQARAGIPELESALARARHALDVLLGRQPGTGETLPDVGSMLPPTDPPPLAVPAALLDRRPDLRQSEFLALASQARIGAAIADLFPDLTISGSYGYQSSGFDDLVTPESEIWSIVTNTVGKLFQGGSLRGRVDRARAEAEAAAADYATAVLEALREVEDALVRERAARERHAHAAERLDAAREAESLATARYEHGLTDLLDLLEVSRRRFDAEAEVVASRKELWDARVALHLAVGGDWLGTGDSGVSADDARVAERSEAP